MTREEILKKAGVSPSSFSPAAWHLVKKILLVVEDNGTADDDAVTYCQGCDKDISTGDHATLLAEGWESLRQYLCPTCKELTK